MFSLQPHLCNVAHKAMKLMLQVLANSLFCSMHTNVVSELCLYPAQPQNCFLYFSFWGFRITV